MKITKEAFENMKKPIEGRDAKIDVHSEVPLATKVAYEDSIKSGKHIQAVKDHLGKVAKSVITDNPGTGKDIKKMNGYTKPLKLDEDQEDFDIAKIKD